MKLAAENAAVFAALGRRKQAGRVHEVGERDAAEAHTEAVEKAAPRKSGGGEWAGADLVVHI